MHRFASLLFLLAGVASSLHAGIRSWESEWHSFRTAYPYHIQVIALSKPNADGNRLLIISEPPPSLKRDDIAQLAPQDFGEIAFPRQRIGYDGWVQDAAIELKPLSDANLKELIDSLHTKIFGTAYKAIAVSIPSSPSVVNHNYNFDLHVPAGSLKRWLLPDTSESVNRWLFLLGALLLALYASRLFGSKRQKRHALALLCAMVVGYQAYGKFSSYAQATRDAVLFKSPFSPKLATAASLMASNSHGVFYSETPGLVLWLVPKSALLNDARLEARRFALDSDIILGSVGDASNLAIVARERVAPIDVIPPLRTETILQLATVDNNELAQSYERTHMFAGKFDGQDDWAPIYLSDELIDTEYGSLLNITDQLLKSWSMAGKVRYINFDYPAPQQFPFPKPLNLYVNASVITFNWNTKGAGYSSQFGSYDVFAWTRTGALPIDYLGNRDSRLHAAEDTGYNFFATRSDPNLVRVVQYAELYQIFRHYGIRAAGAPPAYHPVTPEVFLTQARSVVESLENLPDQRINEGLDGEDAHTAIECKRGVAEMQQEWGDAALQKVISALVAPRAYHKQLVDSGNTDQKSRDWLIAGFAQHCEDTFSLLSSLAPLSRAEIMQAYADSSGRPATGWVRTPSIVVSRPYGEVAKMTGGHNLDSAATLLRASSDLEPGQVKVLEENGQRILEYSAADTDRIQQSVRSVAREEDTSAANLETKAREALAAAKPDTRALPDALNFSATQHPSSARGFEAEHAPADMEKAGWWTANADPSESQLRLAAALDSTKRHTIVIERNGNEGYTIFDGPRHQILRASTKPGTADAISTLIHNEPLAGSAVHLHFRGFDANEAKGFVETAKLQSAGNARIPKFTSTSEDAAFEPAFLKSWLEEKYNFHEVEIQKVSEPMLTADGKTAFDVDASISSVTPERPPLLVRIRVVFEHAFEMTAEMMVSLRDSIRLAFSTYPLSSDGDSLMLTAEFVKSLKKIDPRIGNVELKVTKEGKDLHIVLNRQPGGQSVVAG